MKRKTIFLNIHFWLVVLNAISVFLILQIVFGVFPCRECDWPSDKIERVNSLVVDLAVGVITSTFFYYLLVYMGEWKRSKGVRRVIQWRLNAMAQNMEIIIGYYVWKHSVDYNDHKFLKIQPEGFKVAMSPTKDVINYWFDWEKGGGVNACGSTEKGFICNYVDMLLHHGNKVMESSVFSLEDTELIELIDSIVRSSFVQMVNLMIINPNKIINLGGYGDMLVSFYELYRQLAKYARIDGMVVMDDKGPKGMATIYS